MVFSNLFMLLHNSHSRSFVRLFADTCIALQCKTVLFSRITASAASIGIPEAQKHVLKYDGNLLFFTDLEDVLATLHPNAVFLMVAQKYAKESVPFHDIHTALSAGKVLVIVGGSSPGLTRKELDLGRCIFLPNVLYDLNPIAQTALFLGGLLASRPSI